MRASLQIAILGSMLMVPVSYAADIEKLYLTNVGGKHMVMGGQTAQGTELLIAENGAKPSSCAVGRFYTSDPSQLIITSCENETRYSLKKPDGDMRLSNGQPYPEGSMMVTPSE